MGTQRLRHLSVRSSWIFVFLLPPVFSTLEIQINLESTVFVTFADRELSIEYELKIPEGHSNDSLACYDPHASLVYSCDIPPGQPEIVTGTLELKNLKRSGEYFCTYKAAVVYWFLRVRDEGYKTNRDGPEFIAVAFLAGILLVFSVIGSAFVFRGYLKECITEGGNISGKQKQNRAKKKEKEKKEDNVDVTTAPSTSFYASLDPRPRSIYDVLDRSPANADQRKNKPKKKESGNKMVQETKPPLEDVFESVYENF
ncbi:NFAT activation molecule 1 [Brachionichthys hirsutus]|uniref:NFAT activation molecule 1 n=1 Tax=Brachionichthys hirsutus TaxID=412623 RepID=UPI003604B5C9